MDVLERVRGLSFVKRFKDMGDGTHAEVVSVPGIEVNAGLTSKTATIANGASLSDTVDCGEGLFPVALIIPGAWTPADITFQASIDGTNFSNLYDEDANEITVTANTSRFIVLTPSEWVGVRYLKIRSGSAAAPINQTAERTITVVVRQV